MLRLFQEENLLVSSIAPQNRKSYDAITQLLETRVGREGGRDGLTLHLVQSLVFLFPLKRIQSELKSLLKQQDVTSLIVYKWIKVWHHCRTCTNTSPSL